MNKLEELTKMNFKVTWKLIKIGYLGLEFIQPQLDRKDISDYACIYLKNANDNLEQIVQLIDEKNDEYEFIQILEKLSNSENSDIELQIRKWVIYLTKKMLENLDDNYVEGLLNITEFWVSLGQPSISPHILQGVENSITVQDYYTEYMYNIIVNKHIKWVEEEIEKIIHLES